MPEVLREGTAGQGGPERPSEAAGNSLTPYSSLGISPPRDFSCQNCPFQVSPDLPARPTAGLPASHHQTRAHRPERWGGKHQVIAAPPPAWQCPCRPNSCLTLAMPQCPICEIGTVMPASLLPSQWSLDAPDHPRLSP